MEAPSFVSEDEHWCESAQHYYQKSIDLQKELDEYTEASALLEKELETSLDQKEKVIRELRQQNQRLERENEFIKKKVDRTQQENTHLENEVKSLKTEKENRNAYIRELEQKNDDLERAQRVISESVAGIEALLNQAYERNAVLESEVDEMENLRIKLQRLSDEARDLKQELHVKDRIPNGNLTSTPVQINDNDNSRRYHKGLNGSLDNSRLQIETETQTNLTSTPLKCDLTLNGNTMTPSARISALNIVGDLLRKVGLERFLCPECSKVRCICAKSEKNITTPQNTGSNVNNILENHQPLSRSISRPTSLNLFGNKSISSECVNRIDVKMSPSQRPDRHWLLGILPNPASESVLTNQANTPVTNDCPEANKMTPILSETSGIELQKNNSIDAKKQGTPSPRSFFSRSASFRRSSCPHRPPRSPTKSPAQPL